MAGGIHFKILSNAGVEKKKNRTISVQYISMSYSKVGRGGCSEFCKTNSTWPLQLSIQVNNEKYLFAHAMTSAPEHIEDTCFYLMGNEMNTEYLCNGVEGYTSICGHRNTVNHKIWKNEKGNLIMCDCGCGFIDGKLGCLCLERRLDLHVK